MHIHNRNVLGCIFNLYCLTTNGLPIFVYDLATIITFVTLDCLTVEFSEVRLHYPDRMLSLSNRPSKSFMTCTKVVQKYTLLIADELEIIPMNIRS